MNQKEDWMNHPSLADMDPSKLALLQSLAMQGSQKNQADMMPFLMSIMSGNAGHKMKFSPDEIKKIIEVLKMGKSPEETARIDKMISLMRMLR